MIARPIGDRVLLYFPQTGRLEGGVWVSGETSSRMDAAVVAVGPNTRGLVKAGQSVIADRTSGTPVSYDGISFRLMAEEDILAVLEQ